jgi:hypothetical protein
LGGRGLNPGGSVSGYLKAHGIKVLMVLFSNGITGYLYGPISGKENSIVVMSISWANAQLLLLQDKVTQAIAQGKDAFYIALLSDSIFPYHLSLS